MLKLYQMFHNKETFEQCSKDKRIIKLCVGYDLRNYENINGEFILANEGKYTQNQLVEYPGFYWAANHIDNEKYIGFSVYRHNKVCRTKRSIEQVVSLDYDNLFLSTGVVAFTYHPWNNLIKHDNIVHPGMWDFIGKWLVGTKNITENEWKDICRISSQKTSILRNCFILPTKLFVDYFRFLTDFVEYIDKNYNIEAYSLDIKVPDRNRGWAYFCERIINIYLLHRYGKDLRIGII